MALLRVFGTSLAIRNTRDSSQSQRQVSSLQILLRICAQSSFYSSRGQPTTPVVPGFNASKSIRILQTTINRAEHAFHISVWSVRCKLCYSRKTCCDPFNLIGLTMLVPWHVQKRDMSFHKQWGIFTERGADRFLDPIISCLQTHANRWKLLCTLILLIFFQRAAWKNRHK